LGNINKSSMRHSLPLLPLMAVDELQPLSGPTCTGPYADEHQACHPAATRRLHLDGGRFTAQVNSAMVLGCCA
jgi:hypothetical protein